MTIPPLAASPRPGLFGNDPATFTAQNGAPCRCPALMWISASSSGTLSWMTEGRSALPVEYAAKARSMASRPARGSNRVRIAPSLRRSSIPGAGPAGFIRWSPGAGSRADSLITGPSGDEAGGAVARGVVPHPLGEDQELALELHQPQQVDEQPREPGGIAPQVHAADDRDRRGPADGRHDAEVAIAERRQGASLQARGDEPGGVASLLDRHLGDAGERLAVGPLRDREIPDDEDLRVSGKCQVGPDRHAPGAVRRNAARLGEAPAER